MPTNLHPNLAIRLFGDFDLRIDEKAVLSIDKGRTQSLLAYLVMRSGSPQKRSRLAFTFWPDSEEKQALTNLRNLLHGFRQALPNADSFLQTDSRSLTWIENSPYTLDVEEFERSLQNAQDALESSDLDTAKSELENATTLYRGDLLSKHYDEWIEPERERLRLSICKALEQLIQILKAKGNLGEALHFSKILIQRDTLSDSSHYTNIELQAMNGNRAAALLSFNAFSQVLKDELGIDPGTALMELHRRIVDGVYEVTDYKPPMAIAKESQNNGDNVQPTPINPQTGKIAPSKKPSRFSKFALIFAVGAIVSLLLFRNTNTIKHPSVLDKSIAVLPLENRSNLEEDAYFTDGIHDDLITHISRIRDIKTISRTSVMGYRHTTKNLRTIGKELGVTSILEGGVQRSGNQIRINVQLIDASTDAHLWAKNYTRDLTAGNIFAIQSAIVEDVASSLQAILSPEERQRIDSVPTNDLAALEAYFEGKSLASDRHGEAFERAIEKFEFAIEQDPNFAGAYAALAHVYLNQIYYRGMSREEQIWRAKPLIDEALQIDPNLGEAYAALGTLYRYQDDWSSAVDAYKRAIELNPNDAQTYYQYGNLLEWQFRRPEEALDLMRKAVEFDPENYGNRLILNSSLAALGRFGEAREILESVIREDPENAQAHYDLGRLVANAYFELDQSVCWLRKGFALDPLNPNFPREIAISFEFLSDYQEAAKWMQIALDRAPDSGDADIYRGQVQIYLGNYAEAFTIFRQASKKSDYYAWALYYLSINDIDEGRYEEAIDRILAAYPSLVDSPIQVVDETNFWVTSLVASAHAGLGQSEKVAKLVRRSLALYETMPRMNANQGGYAFNDVCILAVNGQKRKALEKLREALDEGYYPNTLLERPELKILRDEPEFERILIEIKDFLAEQLANLRAMEAAGELPSVPVLREK